MADIKPNEIDPLAEFVSEAPTDQPAAMPTAASSDPLAATAADPLAEFVSEDLNEEKYGGVGQQLKTAAEGALDAATFGLGPAIEREVLGVKDKDRQARAETNPGSRMVGQGLGLLGTLPLGEIGAANVLTKAGRSGAKAIGLGSEAAIAEGTAAARAAGLTGKELTQATDAIANSFSAPARIGSKAVAGAIENAIFQGTDELAKVLYRDPNQSVESAITDIGLSAVLGGAISGGVGGSAELWKVAMGSQTGQLLKTLANKAGGIEGVVSPRVQGAIEQAGIDLAPGVKAAMSEDPIVRELGSVLRQSDTTKSGKAFQADLSKFYKDSSNALAETFGKTGDEVLNAPQFSKYDSGKKLGDTLATEWQEQLSPVSKEFDILREKYGTTELVKPSSVLDNNLDKVHVPGTADSISSQISELASKEGWTSSPSSDIMKEVNRALKEIPNLKTVRDLNHYVTEIGNNTYDFTNPSLTRAGSMMKNILKEAEASVIAQRVGKEEGEQALARYQQARQSYKAQADIMEQLNDRLHVGGSSVSQFAKNLRTMAQTDGESVLRRLSGKGDANLLEVLQQRFPKTATELRSTHADEILQASIKDGVIDPLKLTRDIKKLSPELKAFLFPEEALARIESIETLFNGLKDRTANHSNTARTIDKLFGLAPASAVAMMTQIMSGSPAAAATMGLLTKFLAKDAPDAVKYGLLKFLGSAKQVDAEGFKYMVDYIQSTVKGQNLTGSAVKNVFKVGREVLPQAVMPKERDREKLDKAMREIQTKPESLMGLSDKTGYYMPDHGQAMGQFAANISNYVNSQRPQQIKKSPLDAEPTLTQGQKQDFDNILDIAQQPLVVLNKIKNNSLTSKDVKAIRSMYPSIYNSLIKKMTDEMTKTISKGKTIPYKMRQSLSLFSGMPLDSTMTPAGIMSAQPQTNNQEQGPQAPPQPPKGSSTKNLGKSNSMYQTQSQTLAMRQTSRNK